MKRCLAVALGLWLSVASPLRAQDLIDSCQALTLGGDVPAAVQSMLEPEYRRVCAQVANTMASVQPSVGIAFSGGNPVIGTARNHGRRLGIPGFSVSARANLALAEVPDLFGDDFGQLGTEAGAPALDRVRLPVASLQGDLAVGVFNGFSLAPMVGGIGAIDLLASASFVPALEDLGLDSNILNLGGGVRIGLLRGGVLVPAASVSAMYRRMGTVSFGDMAAGDRADFQTDLNNLSLRAVVSKGILAFDVAAGAGYDHYSSDVGFGWRLVCQTSECLAVNNNVPLEVPGSVDGELTSSAWNAFANVGFNLLVLRAVLEVGFQQADPFSSNGIEGLTDGELSERRYFANAGLRLAL